MKLSGPTLRLDEFDRLTRLRGWKNDAERCQALGISQSHMSRIRRRQIQPGGSFIHRAMKVLQVPYGALFEDGDSKPAAVA